MSPVLIVGIVFAVIALAAAATMCMQFERSRSNDALERRHAHSRATRRARHMLLLGIFVVAGAVYNVCAMVGTSGADILAYVCGWAAFALLIAWAVRIAPSATSAPIVAVSVPYALLACGVVLVVAHVVFAYVV